jgi:hypothetical protein
VPGGGLEPCGGRAWTLEVTKEYIENAKVNLPMVIIDSKVYLSLQRNSRDERHY